MPLNLNSDKLIVVVKPDNTPIYTGSTATFVTHGQFDPWSATTDQRISVLESGSTSPTILIPSGSTAVNNLSGNTWIVYNPTGGTVTLIGSGGTWAGNISGDTWIVYSPPIAQLQIDLFNLEQNFTGHTGNTSIHTPYSAITQAISAATSGLTSSWSGLTGLPTDNPDLVSLLSGYTLTGTTQNLSDNFDSHTGDTSIHFHMNQITGFSQTNHTHDYTGATIINKPSFVGSGATTISLVGNTYRIYSPTGATADWLTLANRPAWLTGTTLSAFQLAHTHSQYLTGVTWNVVSLKPNWVGSGATTVSLVGSDYRIYSPVHVHDTWAEVTGKPAWLSGTTLNAFQTAHSHSQYLTGQTAPSWSSVTGKPAWLSGTTLSAFEAQHAHSTLYKSLFQPRATINANYTALQADNDKILIWSDNNSYTVTLPSSGITIGSHYLFFKQAGTGAITISAGAGSTIFGNCPTVEAGDYIEVFYQSAGVWYVIRKNKPAWTKIQSKPTTVSGYGITDAITGGTNLGTGTTIYTSVASQKLQLKSLKSAGGVSISNDANYITISASTGGGSSAWSGITGKPAWLSGTTLATFELQHRHQLAYTKTVTGTTYTIQSSDGGMTIEFTATGTCAITLPTGLTTNLQCTLISYGNGTTSGVKTLTAGTGASIKSANSALKLATIFGAATIYYRGSNIWVAFGDLTA